MKVNYAVKNVDNEYRKVHREKHKDRYNEEQRKRYEEDEEYRQRKQGQRRLFVREDSNSARKCQSAYIFFFWTMLRASLQLWQSLGCASIVIVRQRDQKERSGTMKSKSAYIQTN